MSVETQWMIAGFVITVAANALVVGMFFGGLRVTMRGLVTEVREHRDEIDTLKLEMVARKKDSASAFRQIDEMKDV